MSETTRNVIKFIGAYTVFLVIGNLIGRFIGRKINEHVLLITPTDES